MFNLTNSQVEIVKHKVIEDQGFDEVPDFYKSASGNAFISRADGVSDTKEGFLKLVRYIDFEETAPSDGATIVTTRFTRSHESKKKIPIVILCLNEEGEINTLCPYDEENFIYSVSAPFDINETIFKFEINNADPAPGSITLKFRAFIYEFIK